MIHLDLLRTLKIWMLNLGHELQMLGQVNVFGAGAL